MHKYAPKDPILEEDSDASFSSYKAKWRVQMDPKHTMSIELGREKYTKYLKIKNNTANKEVWAVYDHLMDDLFAECLQNSLGVIDNDLSNYLEKVIVDEFQLNTWFTIKH